jgi:hypothetical protein
MKRYPMFLDKKTWYFEDISSSPLDCIDLIKLQSLPIKTWASYFVDSKKQILKFIMERQKTNKSQYNNEGENNVRWADTIRLQDWL